MCVWSVYSKCSNCLQWSVIYNTGKHEVLSDLGEHFEQIYMTKVISLIKKMLQKITRYICLNTL